MHNFAFNKFNSWSRKVSLDISHYAPFFLRQWDLRLTGTDLKRTVVLTFNMDWAMERAKVFSWQGFHLHDDSVHGSQMPERNDYTFCAGNKSNARTHTENNNQHAAQDYTTFRCGVSLFRARGKEELLMHLIRRPLESSSFYRYPCPSRRHIQNRQRSGWANLCLLRNMLFALSGRLQLVSRRTKKKKYGTEERETMWVRWFNVSITL